MSSCQKLLLSRIKLMYNVCRLFHRIKLILFISESLRQRLIENNNFEFENKDVRLKYMHDAKPVD